MTSNEVNAIDFLLNTNRYKLTYKLIRENEVPKEHHEGYKKYYRFKIEDYKNKEVISYYSPYRAIPSDLELFFKQRHGHKLYLIF